MENFSVLMSVYINDRADWLKVSIDSVINQNLAPNEIVIVCDGAVNEDCEKLLNSYGDKLSILRLKENSGLGKALAYGLKVCKNDIVARMDSDDISCPDRFQKEMELMDKEKLSLVGSYIDEFYDNPENPISVREVPLTMEDIVPFSKKRNPFNHPSVMFRKSAVEAVGGYEDYPLFEDYFLWVKLIKAGYKCGNIPQVLLHMRSGEDMYKRRGGFSYAKKLWSFRKTLHKSGFTSLSEFLSSSIPHVLVSIMPNFIRKSIYMRALRK